MRIGICRRKCYPATIFETCCEIKDLWFNSKDDFSIWTWTGNNHSSKIDLEEVLEALPSWKVGSRLKPYIPKVIQIQNELVWKYRGSEIDDQPYIDWVLAEIKINFGLECREMLGSGEFGYKSYLVICEPGLVSEEILKSKLSLMGPNDSSRIFEV